MRSRTRSRSRSILARRCAHGTYSIVALDPATGELGVAVQSHWFRVGPLCAWARAGRRRGRDAVGRRARATGRTRSTGWRTASPRRQALGELLAADPLAAVRQVGGDRRARRRRRRTRARTASPHAGHVTGEHWSCQANMMERDTVPAARCRPRSQAATGDARRPAAGRAGRRRGRGRRRARAPVGGDGRRARRRASRGGGASTCASRTTPPRSTSCAGCSASSAPTSWPARPTS